MADDVETEVGNMLMQDYLASRTQAVANYQLAKSQGDYEGVKQAARHIALIDSEMQAVQSLHNRHIASQTPVHPPELTSQEKMAKPIEKCTWADTAEWASKSKHGVDWD